MTNPLAVQGRDYDLTPALNLDLLERRLRSLWGKLARVLLDVNGFFQVTSPSLT